MNFKFFFRCLCCCLFFQMRYVCLCPAQIQSGRLKITLNSGMLSDECILILKPGGNAGLDDRDAVKIGEGHIAVALLGPARQKISIEERPPVEGYAEFNLFVQGFSPGQYELRIKGMPVYLKDRLKNQLRQVPENGLFYLFSMEALTAPAEDIPRFSLLFTPAPAKTGETGKTNPILRVYPNPWRDKLWIRFERLPASVKRYELILKDASGRVVSTKVCYKTDSPESLELDFGSQRPGIYFLQLTDPAQHHIIETLKLIRE